MSILHKELRLLVTKQCNYNCFFCHGEGIKKETNSSILSCDDYIFLAKLCKIEFGWDTITFTGGEPLLRKDITDIAKGMKDIGIHTTLVSNGELIKERFECFSYIDRLNVSIHSFNEDIYTKIVQRENKLNKVLNNIRVLREKNKNIEIRINSTITRNQNFYNSFFDDIISFAKGINASIKFVELFSETDNNPDIVPINEIGNELEKKKFKFIGYDGYKRYYSNGTTQIYLSQITCSMAKESANPGDVCMKNSAIFVTPNGMINLCRYTDEKIDLYDDIKNKDYDNLKEKISICMKKMGKNCILNQNSMLKNRSVLDLD